MTNKDFNKAVKVTVQKKLNEHEKDKKRFFDHFGLVQMVCAVLLTIYVLFIIDALFFGFVYRFHLDYLGAGGCTILSLFVFLFFTFTIRRFWFEK